MENSEKDEYDLTEMNSKKLKIKSIFNCPVCISQYDLKQHTPLLMPCGKSICEKCIWLNVTATDSFWCPFCSNYHQQSKKQFPPNETIVYLIKNNHIDIENDEGEDVGEKKIGNRNASKQFSIKLGPKLNSIFEEIAQNSIELDVSMKKSIDSLKVYFGKLEDEINFETEKLINELKGAQSELIKNLNRQKKTILDQKLKSSQELNTTYISLIDSISKLPTIDEDQNLNFCTQADDLNKRIIRLKQDTLLNSSEIDLKFEKSSIKPEIGQLLNRNKKDDYQKQGVVQFENIAKCMPSTINFKIPANSKNFFMSFQSNKRIVKISEFSDTDDFSFKLNLQLLDLDVNGLHLNKKITEKIGSFRLKRVEANCSNNFLGILLRNYFSNSSNSLMLLNGELEIASKIEFSGQVNDLFMDGESIYVLCSINNGNTINVSKYSYDLKCLKHFILSNFAMNSPRSAVIFLQPSTRLVSIQNEKIYLMNWEKSRMKILDETTGEVLRSFQVDLHSECKDYSWITKVDSMGRVNFFNKILFQLVVYNNEGELLVEKRLEKIASIDYFFSFNDFTYSIIDRNNQLVYFF